MYVVREPADDHLDGRAVLAAVHTDYAFVGAGIFLDLIFASAGDDVFQNRVELFPPVGVGGAGQGRVHPAQNQGADKDDYNRYKQFLVVHFPAPPFMTPKRLVGSALSSAHAQAFMMSMA